MFSYSSSNEERHPAVKATKDDGKTEIVPLYISGSAQVSLSDLVDSKEIQLVHPEIIDEDNILSSSRLYAKFADPGLSDYKILLQTPFGKLVTHDLGKNFSGSSEKLWCKLGVRLCNDETSDYCNIVDESIQKLYTVKAKKELTQLLIKALEKRIGVELSKNSKSTLTKLLCSNAKYPTGFEHRTVKGFRNPPTVFSFVNQPERASFLNVPGSTIHIAQIPEIAPHLTVTKCKQLTKGNRISLSLEFRGIEVQAKYILKRVLFPEFEPLDFRVKVDGVEPGPPRIPLLSWNPETFVNTFVSPMYVITGGLKYSQSGAPSSFGFTDAEKVDIEACSSLYGVRPYELPLVLKLSKPVKRTRAPKAKKNKDESSEKPSKRAKKSKKDKSVKPEPPADVDISDVTDEEADPATEGVHSTD